MNGKIKDPGSAVTHFIGMFLACAAMLPLLAKASTHADRRYPACMAIFMVCMVTLYAASTIYHTFDISRKVNRILQKLDHSAISLLIAGSYTPVCLLELEQPTGKRLCILVWLIALVSRSSFSGSAARSGFLQCSISAWAGSVSLRCRPFTGI